MTHPILPRRLWHETKEGRVLIEQVALIGRPEPLIILGEPGMGKTELLYWLGHEPGYFYCTARSLKNKPNPRRHLDAAHTLVIDALDELSVQGEGDAVDLVLQKLGDLDHPPFVLSCRVADWRNATGVSAIREQYGDVDLLVLHLEPLTDDEVHQLLAAELDGGGIEADAVVTHFTKANLEGLLGNPQTLELVARVAKAGRLPNTKAELFERAVELLRREHRDSKADVQPAEATALDAAGAAFAALILTGSDALVVETAEPSEGEIPLNEIAALPHARDLHKVLGSRLFKTAGAANHFTYWHRRIGEYVGSRWLARQADTVLKRKRLLALFHSRGVVPAALRGLHAWLAHHSIEMASEVIAADPMSVIEYGDADKLDATQARALLAALQRLAKHNPYFRGWQSHSLKSVVQPPLLPDVRALINNASIEMGLRLLLIEAVAGSPIADALRQDLRCILLDRKSVFALGSRAIDALVALGGEDWHTIVATLRAEGSDDALRLALEILDKVGLEPFNDAMIIGLVITQAQRKERVVGLTSRVTHAVPDGRVESLLDQLVIQIAALGHRHERAGNNELTDLGYTLIAQRLAMGPIDVARLWAWLRPFDAETGYNRETRAEVHKLIREDDALRRAGQRLVLLEQPGPKTVWERAWSLSSRTPGFATTPADVMVLLQALDPAEHDDQRWRDLLRMTPHSATEGAEVRELAKRFVANRRDLNEWIDKLVEPPVPKWQIKQKEEERRRAAKRAMQWQEHRREFAQHKDALHNGDFQFIISPAQGYLGYFHELTDQALPQDRLIEWLGTELAQAALKGFEAYLQSDQPPTARQMSKSHAKSRSWNGTSIIVAALAERARNGLGFKGVSDDRLTTGFYEVRQTNIAQHAKLEGLPPALMAEMQARGLVEAALIDWVEPQLKNQQAHVDQLYALMRTDVPEERAVELATDWLTRYPDMAVDAEAEMIDRLIASRQFDTLRRLATSRLCQPLNKDRRRNWNTVAFLADFEAQCDRLGEVAEADPAWIWTIRQRLAGDRGRTVSAQLTVDQYTWLMTTFRCAFPSVEHPTGVVSGNANPWDASDFLGSIVNRLADISSDKAIIAMRSLRDAPADSYTTYLRALAAEQQRKDAEKHYLPPSFASVRAIVEAQPPRTVADLQTTLLALIDQVQTRITASPPDPFQNFYTDNGAPHDEEHCRNFLLTMLGERPESITLDPEGHLADDNRADIIAQLNGLRLPIEIKGQWHPEVWRAADEQLDRLYATDHAAAGRGIYLVLWFGLNVSKSKKPRAQARGRRRPQTPDEMRQGLVAASQAARDERIAVVVLDLERSPRT